MHKRIEELSGTVDQLTNLLRSLQNRSKDPTSSPIPPLRMANFIKGGSGTTSSTGLLRRFNEDGARMKENTAIRHLESADASSMSASSGKLVSAINQSESVDSEQSNGASSSKKWPYTEYDSDHDN